MKLQLLRVGYISSHSNTDLIGDRMGTPGAGDIGSNNNAAKRKVNREKSGLRHLWKLVLI